MLRESVFLPSDAPGGARRDNAALAGAFDNQRSAARVGQPERQRRLVFGRIVPAAGGSGVGKLDDHDALRLGAALEQLGLPAARDEAPAILRDAGAGERPVRLVSGRIGNLDLDDEIGGPVFLLWPIAAGPAA